MQHLGTQPLETARLRLDRLRLEQAADYTHIWDPEPIDEAAIQARAESLARRIAQFDRPEGYCWGLYLSLIHISRRRSSTRRISSRRSAPIATAGCSSTRRCSRGMRS